MGNVTFAADRFNARRQTNDSANSLGQTESEINATETAIKFEKYCQDIIDILKNDYIGSEYFYYFLDGSEQSKEDELAEKACYFYSNVDGLVWRVVEYKMSNSDTNFQYRIETADYIDQDQTYIINPNQKPTRVVYSYTNNTNSESDYIDAFDSLSTVSLGRLDVLKIMISNARPISTAEALSHTNPKTPIIKILKLTKE